MAERRPHLCSARPVLFGHACPLVCPLVGRLPHPTSQPATAPLPQERGGHKVSAHGTARRKARVAHQAAQARTQSPSKLWRHTCPLLFGTAAAPAHGRRIAVPTRPPHGAFVVAIQQPRAAAARITGRSASKAGVTPELEHHAKRFRGGHNSSPSSTLPVPPAASSTAHAPLTLHQSPTGQNCCGAAREAGAGGASSTRHISTSPCSCRASPSPRRALAAPRAGSAAGGGAGGAHAQPAQNPWRSLGGAWGATRGAHLRSRGRGSATHAPPDAPVAPDADVLTCSRRSLRRRSSGRRPRSARLPTQVPSHVRTWSMARAKAALGARSSGAVAKARERKAFRPRLMHWDRLRGCAGKVTRPNCCTPPLSGLLRHPE